MVQGKSSVIFYEIRISTYSKIRENKKVMASFISVRYYSKTVSMTSRTTWYATSRLMF